MTGLGRVRPVGHRQESAKTGHCSSVALHNSHQLQENGTMKNELELEDELHQKIKLNCAHGDKLAEARKFEDAIAEYNKAWLLIPNPKNQWEAATWVLAAVTDAAHLANSGQSRGRKNWTKWKVEHKWVTA